MSLLISESDLAVIRHHAETGYPNEICGVLVGTINADSNRHVSRVVECTNAAVSNARSRYEIAPVELFHIQRDCRGSNTEIIGFYHSHPDHPAKPSPTDLSDAHWFGCSYVITSVHQAKAHETKSFVLAGTEDAKHFNEEPIPLVPAR